MAIDIGLNLYRNALGDLESGYIPVEDGVNFIGTVGHGNTMTITLGDDTGLSFGSRSNVKPLFVNLGDGLSGNVLGRITTQHLNTNLISDSVIKAGSLPSSWKLNIKTDGDVGFFGFGQAVTTQDQTKPLIQYIERRYGFAFDDPTIQCNGYYFSSPPWSNTNLFTFTIDGRVYSHTNDGSPASADNAAAVATILAAAINADSLCKCTANANDGTFELRLLKKNTGDNFTVSTSGSIYQNFNNKANRVYSWNDSTSNDAILITREISSAQSYIENTTGSTGESYYDARPSANSWMNEELILKNSSSAGVSDGYYRHYKNAELLNPLMAAVTHNVGQQPLGRCYLNQYSNGVYGYFRTGELPIHVGYQCWDDEYAGIYLSDTPTIVEGTTNLVRQPQTSWTSNIVQFKQIHSLVNPSASHVFLRTSETNYTYLGAL